MLRRWTDQVVQTNLAQSKYNAPDISPMDRAGAHGTWFGAGIKSAGSKLLRGIMPAGKPHEIRFGMTGAISACDHGIFGPQQHLIVFVNQQRAKGMVAMFARLPCNISRGSEMLKICLVHR